jgi:RNA polymerase sigma-70 factor (ECF subfamily)
MTLGINALLTELCKPLRALVRSRLSKALGLDADEIEQEVRLKLWRVLERENVIQHPPSYLHRAVMSVIVDHIRKLKRAPVAMPEHLSVPDNAGTQAHAEQLGDLVQRALSQLPERRRRPVALHLQGFDLSQIARMEGESEGTVRNLVYRGLDEMRAHLKQWGIDHA